MAYSYTGYGPIDPDSSYKTNSGLSYNENIKNIAYNAWKGKLEGFDSAYSVSGGCTWWASGRSVMSGGPSYPNKNAANWFDTYGGEGGIPAKDVSASDIEPGDVLCFDDGGFGHVAFVESVSSSSIHVSESADGTNNYNIVMMSSQSISSLISNKHHWFWSDEKFEGVLKGSGVAPGPDPPEPGPDPPDPPGPDPGGRWEYDHTEYVTIDRTLCNDQQNPDVPSAEEASGIYPTGEDIQDVRWDSIYYYTDERQIHYNHKSIGYWEEDWQEISNKEFVMNWSD